MELIKTIRDNDKLRSSFNLLTEQTFGFNFEEWYRLGYWREDYRPYAMVENGKVIANVSVNHTDFFLDGQTVRLIQLGTVMTDPDFRNRGLIRSIMAEIESDYTDTADGMYLFANDEVLDFYPKFGFRKGSEWQYEKEVALNSPAAVEQRSMKYEKNRLMFEYAMHRASGAFPMIGNVGLTFFYVSSFMSECVWYAPGLDAWAIAEKDGSELMLHAVYGAGTEEMIAAFGEEICHVTLGYVPEHPEPYQKILIQEEDCTFFVKGGFFDSLHQNCFVFRPCPTHKQLEKII